MRMFTCVNDGTQFGPTKSTAIDMMHMPQRGFYFMDDTKVTIADLFRAPGERLLWCYDLGGAQRLFPLR